MNRFWVCLLLLAASVAAAAQSTGRVIFYHPRDPYKAFHSNPVVIDGKELPAHLKVHEYYQVDLPPGRHVFRASDKNYPIGLDVEGGQTYYLSAEWHAVTMGLEKTVFVIVDKPTGEEQLKMMHYKDLSTPDDVNPYGRLVYSASH